MVLFGGSLLNQFVGSFDRVNWLSTFRFDAVWFSDRRQWVQWIWDIHSVFDFWKIKIKIYVWVDVTIVPILNFDALCSISALLPDLMMVWTILLFFRDFFWRSGLFEYWIRLYVRGHWFGCSLRRRPGTPLNSPCQEVGFISPFVVIDPTDLGATTVVATTTTR